MRYIWENNWFFVPIAMFLGFCGVLAILVPYGHELLFFNALRVEPLNTFFRMVTYGGEAIAYLMVGLALLFWRPRFALMIALMGILAMPVMYILKDAIGVDRPITYFEKNISTSDIVLVPSVHLNRGQTSFPSGHTMAAFALFGLLSLMLGRKHAKWGLLFAFLAVLVGVSRIFLVQHFLIDVLAGAVLGLLLSGLIWIASARFLPSNFNRPQSTVDPKP